ncbi:hypothetical protein Q7C36_007452 [Tachysurus vachellii]|uniref:Uncharacterized protein n=2 Tax=Tachysurus vachellii TaxID=175792 RepID=A0AA88N8Q3_TACVA|nr:hypothetical protein Q7C36_007452 [Tachysurus vachellii]
MAEPNTLNELRDLMQIGFGRRFPRHGLKLLYWFANNCVDFDDNNMMRWKNDRARGRFGFHLFINRTEDNDERLLPVLNHGYNYYEVGNLCRPGAEYLPYYVWAELNNDLDGDQSNMERIIFSVVDERIDRVYVTEHINESNFNREATFEISSGLIAIIKQLTLEEFLEQIDD